MFFASENIYFPIKNSFIFHVFSKPLPGTVLRGSPCRSLLNNLGRVPFSNSGFKKRHLLDTIFCKKKLKRRGRDSEPERHCRVLAFHETIVIAVMLGPTGFLKIVLGLEVDPFSFFMFFCVLFDYLTF